MIWLVVIAVVLATVAVLIRVFENRFIYFPPRYPEGFVTTPQSFGLQVEEVWLTAEDNVRINGWFLPSTASVLLWFHGNAENIGMGIDRMIRFAALGSSIFEIDYRGYGKSEGTPNEAGLYRDGEAAYRYLVEVRGFRPSDIIIYGHSLGGAVAVEIASRHECGGLIVESSFTSISDMARIMFRVPLVGFIAKSKFDSERKIANIRAPVLVIHGTRDWVIPFFMGQMLFEAAREPKAFFPVEGAGHDDPFFVGGKEYYDRLLEFIQGVKLPAKGV